MPQFLLSFWFMAIFECNYNSYSVCYPSLRADVIMPSIVELAFVYVHYTVVHFRVFKVVSFIIHSDCNDIMSTFIVIFVAFWIICRLKYLEQNNNWVSFFEVLLKLLSCHILFTIKVVNSLDIPIYILSYLFKAILKLSRSCSFCRHSPRCLHNIRLFDIKGKRMKNCLHTRRTTRISSIL